MLSKVATCFILFRKIKIKIVSAKEAKENLQSKRFFHNICQLLVFLYSIC